MKPHIRLRRSGSWYAGYVYISRTSPACQIMALSDRGWREVGRVLRKKWPAHWRLA